MVLLIPNYYKRFKCIAEHCRHSCCIGWEIDIDNEALNKYNNLNTAFGKEIQSNIAVDKDETPHFRLDKNERCPLLNSNGLCNIILNLGEDALCQICSDHPRFRNFYSERTEIGLGMCCEAAAKLILEQTEKFELTALSDCAEKCDLSVEETEFLKTREDILAVLQNRRLPIEERIKKLLCIFKTALPSKEPHEWADIFMALERLNPLWDKYIGWIKTAEKSALSSGLPTEFSTPIEQLLVYFAYRHCDKYFDGFEFSKIIQFIILSYNIIKWLCLLHMNKNGSLTIDDIAEFARMYSAEIEYSSENTEKLFEILI